MQLEPSFVALLEDDILDPATDLSTIAVREQHADGRPHAFALGSWNYDGLEDGDCDVGNGGLVDGDIGGVGDGDIWNADGDVWDRDGVDDVEMEEVEDHKLMEDGNAMDNASRPEAGIGVGVRAAASVGGASRLPGGLGVKWQAAGTQVRILLTHCSLQCTALESFRLRVAYMYDVTQHLLCLLQLGAVKNTYPRICICARWLVLVIVHCARSRF